MLRDPKVIEHLNRQLTNELTAVNQYCLHARALQHWGVTKLGKQEYAESIGEMKHADELIKRILFLDGLPNVQRLDPIRVGEDVEHIRGHPEPAVIAICGIGPVNFALSDPSQPGVRRI